MESKRKAIREVLGFDLGQHTSRKFFYNTFTYLLYHDTQSLFEAVDYKQRLQAPDKPQEKYLVFKYMLQLLRERHPQQLEALNPLSPTQSSATSSPYQSHYGGHGLQRCA